MLATTLLLILACVREDSVPVMSPEKKRASVEQAFSGATSITLYSVAPGVYDHFGNARKERSAPKDALAALEEGDGVFGSVQITDRKSIEKIGEAFLEGYLEDGPMAFCYIPHHVLRVKGDGHDLQLHLCFECHYAAVLLGPGTKYDVFQDVSGLQAMLDERLAAAKIPVRTPWMPYSLDSRDREYVVSELGTDTVAALESAERLELFSLDPETEWGKPVPKNATGESIAARLEAREGVLGSTVIERDAVRGEVLARAFASIRKDATAAKCFLPRHALRFTHGTRTIVVLVCFECTDLHVVADARSDLIPIRDVAGLESRLNSILKARGIPIAD